MKVFLSSDMEGTAGIVDWEQCVGDGPQAAAGRALLLDEVNAAIEGAVDGGATEIVLMPTCSAPGFMPARIPSAPNTTDSTAVSSASIETTTSAPAAAARGVSAIVAWGTCRVFSAVRFQARNLNPSAARFRAIARPICPRPSQPAVMSGT